MRFTYYVKPHITSSSDVQVVFHASWVLESEPDDLTKIELTLGEVKILLNREGQKWSLQKYYNVECRTANDQQLCSAMDALIKYEQGHNFVREWLRIYLEEGSDDATPKASE